MQSKIKKSNIFISLCILLCYCNNLYSQYIGYKKPQSKFIVIDTNGEIVIEFPERHMPFQTSTTIKSYERLYNNSGNWEIELGQREINRNDDFFIMKKGTYHITISSKDSSYIYNLETGETINCGNKFTYLGQPRFGKIVAFSKIENQSSSYLLNYLDTVGNALFNGEQFWNASDFNEDFAVVQKEIAGDWFLLSHDGETLKILPNTFSNEYTKAYMSPTGNAYISRFRDSLEVVKLFDSMKKQNVDFPPDLEDGNLFLNHKLQENDFSNINLTKIPNCELYFHDGKHKLTFINFKIDSDLNLKPLNIYNTILSDDYQNNLIIPHSDVYKILEDNIVIDSISDESHKYYLFKKDTLGFTFIIDDEMNELILPENFMPIKCNQNHILGTKWNQIMFYDIRDKTYIKADRKKYSLMNIFINSSYKEMDEFILLDNKVLKYSPGHLYLTNIDGDSLHSNVNENISFSLENDFNVKFTYNCSCLKKDNIQEIERNKIGYLKIECESINLKNIINASSLKYLILIGVKKLDNIKYIDKLLEKEVEIYIRGSINRNFFKQWKNTEGSLYLNDNLITLKTER